MDIKGIVTVILIIALFIFMLIIFWRRTNIKKKNNLKFKSQINKMPKFEKEK